MLLLERDATPMLCHKVKSIRHERESWRCIHLKLSGEQARHNQMLRAHFVIRGIRERLSGQDCAVYVCEDSDIFILFQGRAKPVMQRLSTYFADMEEEHAIKGKEALFSIYDLSKDWLFLFVLCQRKLTREEAVHMEEFMA